MMQPAQINPALMGQLENYTHQASLIYVNQNMEHKKIKESVYDMFNHEKDIRFGISAAPQNAVIVRILGFKAEQLFRLLNSISTFIQSVSPKENAIN
jgi:urease accessory protein